MLDNRAVAVQNGSTGQVCIEKIMGKNNPHIKKTALSLQMILNNQVDALVCDDTQAKQLIQQYPNQDLKIIYDDNAFPVEYFCIMYPKNSIFKENFEQMNNSPLIYNALDPHVSLEATSNSIAGNSLVVDYSALEGKENRIFFGNLMPYLKSGKWEVYTNYCYRKCDLALRNLYNTIDYNDNFDEELNRILKENYQSFDEYKLTFKENNNGDYYFDNIEKVNK